MVVELAGELIGDFRGRRISVLGLAFKPGTDDVRDAVSIRIVRRLVEEGAKVVVYDPKAMDNAKKIFGENVEYANSVEECLKDSECAIIVTEWDEFRKLRPEDFIRLMRNPAVVDGRRIYDPEVYSRMLKFKAIGFNCWKIS
jgi:UDPglucose 6-dehydrogenase